MAIRAAFVSAFVSSFRRNPQHLRFASSGTVVVDDNNTQLEEGKPRQTQIKWSDYRSKNEANFEREETQDEIVKLGMLEMKMLETFGSPHGITQSMAPYLRMIEHSGKKAPFTLSDETERDLIHGLDKIKPKENYTDYKELVEDFLDRVIGVERGAGWEFEDTVGKQNEIMDMAETLILAKGAKAVSDLLKEGDMDAKLRRSIQELVNLKDDATFHSSLFNAPTKLFLRPTLKAQHQFMNRIYKACLEYGDSREVAKEKAVASNYVNMGSDWVRRSVEIDWERKCITMQVAVFNDDHKIVTDLDLTPDRRLHMGPLGMLSPCDRAIGNRVCNTIAHDPESISFLKYKHQNAIMPVFARQCILKNTFEFPMRGEWWNVFRRSEWPTSYVHRIVGRVEDSVPAAETLEV
uniref:Uncharacterized protein n=1 Tax=Paramoeba aestuarina TaxID=180227 RepID=A0A7S4KS76_9EUKA